MASPSFKSWDWVLVAQLIPFSSLCPIYLAPDGKLQMLGSVYQPDSLRGKEKAHKADLYVNEHFLSSCFMTSE